MYTKFGLGLLAAAGLTFGVIGMQAGGASPTSTACTNPDGSVSAAPSDGSNATAGDQDGANPSGSNAGTGAEGNGLNGGNGSGNGSDNGAGNGSGNGGGVNGPTTTTPPTTGNGNPGTRAADDRFLILREGTDETDVVDGTATVPPTNAGATGRSRIVSKLIRIEGHVYGRR